MRATLRSALVLTSLLGGLALAVVVTGGPAGASAEVPICERALPAATAGAVTLDTPTVPAGTRALGLLTGIAPWPAHLIGGGSGETFLSCTPWTPQGQAEVIPSPDAGVFQVDVPAGTPAGSYPVGVVYYEGSVLPSSGGTLVRLSTTLTVSADPVPVASTGVACALTGVPASTGQLVGADTATAGGVVPLSIDGFSGEGWILNEYDEIRFLACLDGATTPVPVDLSTAPYELAVPVSAAPGPHVVRVWGVVAGEVVWWERTITVSAAAAPAPAPAPAPAARELATTGVSTGPAVVLGAALVVTGLGLVLVRRRGAGALDGGR